MRHFFIKLLFLFFLSTRLTAQDDESAETDLLALIPDEKTQDFTKYAFKSPRVINGHSMEMLNPGTMDFRILHRFGELSGGGYELFGLDQASMRMGFDFGLTNNLMVGVGRSTVKKEVDGFVKYRILWQQTGKKNIPLSVVWVSGIAINGLKDPVGIDGVSTTLSRRLGYYHEVIIGRKFSEILTLQIAPTLVHRNIVANKLIPNNLYAIGFGGRAKINKRLAIVWDYHHALNRFPNVVTANPLSLGVDIETGGHVFQLHFSNSAGLNERAFVADTNGDWSKGQIRFGFNLSRVFQIKKQKI